MHSVLTGLKACVMNFITYNNAYALYPIKTFEKKCSLVTGNRDQPQPFLKYMDRGFAMQHSIGHAVQDIGVYRSTGDRWTWTLPLNMDGIRKRLPLTKTSDILPWDPSVPNTWTMVDNGGPKMKYELKAYTINRYEYLIAHMEHSSMMDDLFDELSWFEEALMLEQNQQGMPVLTW